MGPKKRLKLDWTGPIRTGPVVYLWTGLFRSGCQLPSFQNIIGPIKNRFKSVETGLSYKPVLDHISTHIFINFRPWTIKKVENWSRYDQNKFCTSILS